jgi:hypothetical protein
MCLPWILQAQILPVLGLEVFQDLAFSRRTVQSGSLTIIHLVVVPQMLNKRTNFVTVFDVLELGLLQMMNMLFNIVRMTGRMFALGDQYRGGFE